MANYSMTSDTSKGTPSKPAGDGGRGKAIIELSGMPRWMVATICVLVGAAVVVTIACAVVSNGERASARSISAKADQATQQAASLRSGKDGDSGSDSDSGAGQSAVTQVQTDLVPTALEAASRVADLQNSYDGAKDDDLTKIADQLGALLSDDDQSARSPWLQNSSLSKDHHGKWVASSYASAGAGGDVSLTWLFTDDSDGSVLGWATADFDGYHVHDVEHGTTPAGRDALADNPVLDDDLVANDGK